MRLFNQKPSRKKLVFILIIMSFVLVLFLVPQEAKAAVVDAAGNAVALVVGTIVKIIVAVLGWVITLAISLIVVVAQYNDFTNSPVVSIGWILVRDVCNMFFILILLVIAFSTVLGWEKFHYKKNLVPLLTAAVFINFSKLMCGLLIDLSQVIMLAFVSAFAKIGGGNFAELVGLDQLLSASQTLDTAGKIAAPGGWELTGGYILALVLAGLFLIVLSTMLAILIARIITLWFMVVLSPFALMAQAIPGPFQTYAGKWWSEFTNQLVIGPVMAFFIWLSLSVVNESTQGMGEVVGAGGLTAPAVGSTNITKPEILLKYVIGIGLMYGSLMMVQMFSSMATKLGGKISSGATKVIKGVTKLGLEKTRIAPVARALGERALRGVDMAKEQRQERTLRREAWAQETVGGKAGARLRAEMEIKGLQRKTLEEKVGPLRDMTPVQIDNLLKTASNKEKDLLWEAKAGKGKLTEQDLQDFDLLSPKTGVGKEAHDRFRESLISKQGGEIEMREKFKTTLHDKGYTKAIEEAQAKAGTMTARQIDERTTVAGLQKDDSATNAYVSGFGASSIKGATDAKREAIQKALEEIVAGKRKAPSKIVNQAKMTLKALGIEVSADPEIQQILTNKEVLKRAGGKAVDEDAEKLFSEIPKTSNLGDLKNLFIQIRDKVKMSSFLTERKSLDPLLSSIETLVKGETNSGRLQSQLKLLEDRLKGQQSNTANQVAALGSLVEHGSNTFTAAADMVVNVSEGKPPNVTGFQGQINMALGQLDEAKKNFGFSFDKTLEGQISQLKTATLTTKKEWEDAGKLLQDIRDQLKNSSHLYNHT